MGKKIIILGGAFLLVIALVLIMLADTGSTIVGAWQDVNSSSRIEFTSDGKYIVRDLGQVDSGTYTLVGKNTVTVTIGDNFSYTFPYSISGDTMKTLDGANMEFKRISR